MLGSPFRARPGHDVTLNQVQRDLEDANRKRDSDSGLGDEIVTFTASYLAKPHERVFVYRGAAAATLTLPPPATSYGRQRSFLLRATNRGGATITIRFDPTTTTTLAAGASILFWSDGTAFASVT